MPGALPAAGGMAGVRPCARMQKGTNRPNQMILSQFYYNSVNLSTALALLFDGIVILFLLFFTFIVIFRVVRPFFAAGSLLRRGLPGILPGSAA